MTRTIAMLGLLAICLAAATPAAAKCSDEIKTLEGKASGTDAANKPGQQKQTGNSETTSDHMSGGTKSASEIVLRAKAYDEKGDETNCMKSVEEAKAATNSK